MICCLFFLLSFLSYTHAIQTRHISNRRSYLYILLSTLLAFLSILSKEQGITALGVCAAYDILMHWPDITILLRSLFIKRACTDSDEKNGGKKILIYSDCKAVIKRLCKLISLSRVTRRPCSSPAVASNKMHNIEQHRILIEALGLPSEQS